MNFDELMKSLEKDEVPSPSESELNKMAQQLLVESSADPADQSFVKKVAAEVISELRLANPILFKSAGQPIAENPSNLDSVNPKLKNPVDQPPAAGDPRQTSQAQVAQAMTDPAHAPAAVAAGAGNPGQASAVAAQVTLTNLDDAELHQAELNAVAETAQALINNGVTQDPLAALAAASLATIEDSLQTQQSAGEAAGEAGQESAEAMAENIAASAIEQKVAEVIHDYGKAYARNLIRQYLDEGLL